MTSTAERASRGPAAPAALGQGAALLLVDLQHDFVHPDGGLHVPGATDILPLVNRLSRQVAARGALVAASLDWHPPRHVSFHTSHPRGRPGQLVPVSVGEQQMEICLFPSHCVAGTPGAEFADGLDTSHVAHTVKKGRREALESFSAFYDMARVENTGLADWLRAHGVHTLLVCGVATEYCVKASVLDGLSEGFNVVLLTDAVAGVEPAACQAALEEMAAAGAVLARGAQLLAAPRPPEAEQQSAPAGPAPEVQGERIGGMSERLPSPTGASGEAAQPSCQWWASPPGGGAAAASAGGMDGSGSLRGGAEE